MIVFTPFIWRRSPGRTDRYPTNERGFVPAFRTEDEALLFARDHVLTTQEHGSCVEVELPASIVDTAVQS